MRQSIFQCFYLQRCKRILSFFAPSTNFHQDSKRVLVAAVKMGFWNLTKEYSSSTHLHPSLYSCEAVSDKRYVDLLMKSNDFHKSRFALPCLRLPLHRNRIIYFEDYRRAMGELSNSRSSFESCAEAQCCRRLFKKSRFSC